MADDRAAMLMELDNSLKVTCPRVNNETKKEQIKQKLKGIHIDGATVLKIGDKFLEELELGICGKPSSLQMEDTYIPELPDGTEDGEFLALDLGGTNFRVLHLLFHKGHLVKENIKHYHIKDELRLGCGIKLFDFLAECISSFVKEVGLEDKKLPLGFTFSFPMQQKALDIGILLKWAISFKATGVEGENVVQMLRDAISRQKNKNVEVVAILNDATGTFLQGALLDHKTHIGLILGSGTNACYLERADRFHHSKFERKGEREIIIDTEFGAFGDNGALEFIRTSYDCQVDNNSVHVNSFMFEKFIGGKFLGEIVRVILEDLAKDKLLFNGDISKKFLMSYAFSTTYISSIEKDSIEGSSKNTEQILSDFEQKYTQDDVAIVGYVCELVSLRAAVLVSVCLAEILKHMNKLDSTIAVDGSLYKYHPRMKQWLNQYTAILAPKHKFQLLFAEDGSGKGAGVAAAIAIKFKTKGQQGTN